MCEKVHQLLSPLACGIHLPLFRGGNPIIAVNILHSAFTIIYNNIPSSSNPFFEVAVVL